MINKKVLRGVQGGGFSKEPPWPPEAKKNTPIYSGASPEQVAKDLKPLVEFQDEGLSFEALSDLIDHRLVPHLMKYDRSGFQSMFNAIPEKGAELGAQIALAFNQGVTNWQVSPGGAMLEELCCKALCKLFGLPPEADATFMYCGTYANQEALYLALHRKAEECGFDLEEKGLMGFADPGRLTVLTSEDAHFSVKQAVHMLGLGERNLVSLAVDKNRRIDMKHAERAISELQKTRDIFCVVLTAGTTSTGTVDPILPMVKISRRLGAWLHVDGAYGLAYSLVPEWKQLFAGIEQADSVSWDPHKQMAVPIPNSLLFVNNKADFYRITLYGHYFNREEDAGAAPNPGLKSPPTTRPLTALSLVASIRYQGLKGVIERLRAPLTAIRALAEHLEKEADIQLAHAPDTGILCFRIRPEDVPENRLNDLQEYVYRKILSEGKRSISISKLGNKTVLRLVAVSPSLTIDALLETIANIRTIGAEYLKKTC
ncbi:MAG: aminotransferase class V-fold PLP-dependent enzyme [Candidatus Aminicenantes bacterium]|jgi:L-2,4-diaminobutyrate decarboxylase